MLFDEQVFRMAMKKLTAEGNRDAVEDYLLSEFWRLEEGDIAVADSCCCGKSACKLEEEDISCSGSATGCRDRSSSEANLRTFTAKTKSGGAVLIPIKAWKKRCAAAD